MELKITTFLNWKDFQEKGKGEEFLSGCAVVTDKEKETKKRNKKHTWFWTKSGRDQIVKT